MLSNQRDRVWIALWRHPGKPEAEGARGGKDAESLRQKDRVLFPISLSQSAKGRTELILYPVLRVPMHGYSFFMSPRHKGEEDIWKTFWML